MLSQDLPEILTMKQACALLNCHANTLRNWEKQGIIACIRFGKRGDRRFKKEEILKLLEKPITKTPEAGIDDLMK
ncbi:helix-turn-helix domain-containing protein [Patescibacteria group bacterium]|nr:helix-turn-helix domain-containing protein [Patescibacteria group bacterium]